MKYFNDLNLRGWDDGIQVSRLSDNDFDGDVIVDHLGLDSDNHGLPDIAKSNADGIIPFAAPLRRLCSIASLLGITVAITGCSGLSPKTTPEPTLSEHTQRVAYNRDYDRFNRSFYGSIGVGSSWLEPDTSEVEGFDPNDRVNTGGQLTLGVDLSRQVSVELHSADLGSAGLSPTGRINYHETGLSLLTYAGKNRHRYRRQGLTGFARIGVGVLDNSAVGNVNYVQDNQTHLLLGLGMEFMTRIGLGLRAEVIAFEEDVRYAQLGLVYRTGKRRERRTVQVVEAPVETPVIVPEPAPVAPVVAAVKVFVPDPCDQLQGELGVNFHVNSADLTAEAASVLNQMSVELAGCEQRPLSINAHTDSDGSENYNQSLSQRRAESVVEYLIGQGLSRNRFNAVGYGEAQPIDTNATPEGRSRNRRVEVSIQ